MTCCATWALGVAAAADEDEEAEGGEEEEAFAARVAAECEAAAGVRVRAWSARFAEGPRAVLRGARAASECSSDSSRDSSGE